MTIALSRPRRAAAPPHARSQANQDKGPLSVSMALSVGLPGVLDGLGASAVSSRFEHRLTVPAGATASAPPCACFGICRRSTFDGPNLVRGDLASPGADHS